MGVVYRAEGPEGQTFALKVLLDHDPDSVERFEREALIAESLLHPNVVRVHAHGVHQGRPYLVMDFVEGEDLMARIKRDGPLPEVEARRVFAALSEALLAAHRQGVLHRDLKPQNVLLEGDRVLLSDFGLARRGPSTLTATGELLGTPAYMAPEQALGERGAVGFPADIYGLGATIYAALCGRPPHEEATLFATLDKVLNAAPTPLRSLRDGELSVELEELVRHCLAKDPQERPVAEEVLQRLSEGRRRSGRAGWAISACLLGLGVLASVAIAKPDPAPASPTSSVFLPTPVASLAAASPTESPAVSASPVSSVSDQRRVAEIRKVLEGCRQALRERRYRDAGRGADALFELDPGARGSAPVELLMALGRWADVERVALASLPVSDSREDNRIRFALGRARAIRAVDSPPKEFEALRVQALEDLRAANRVQPTARSYAWQGRLELEVARDRPQAEACLEAAKVADPTEPALILLAHDLDPSGKTIPRSKVRFSFDLGLLYLRYQVGEGRSEDEVKGLVDRLRDMERGEGRIARSMALGYLRRTLARKQGRGPDLERAISHLERALQEAPPGSVRRRSILDDLSYALAELRQFEAAAEKIDAALAIYRSESAHPERVEPIHLRRVAIHHKLARQCLASWDVSGTDRSLQHARESLDRLSQAPLRMRWRQELLWAQSAARSSRFQEAEEANQRALKILQAGTGGGLEKEVSLTHISVGRTRLLASALGYPAPPAAPSLERALELKSDSTNARVWLAHALADSQPERARALAREVIAKAPRGAHGMVELLVAPEEDGWEAIRAFLVLEPGNPRVLGMALIHDPIKAQAFFEKVPQTSRDHPLVLLASSRVGRTKGGAPRDWAERTESRLTQALERYPRCTWLRAERGLIRATLGNNASAREDVARAQRERPHPNLEQILRDLPVEDVSRD